MDPVIALILTRMIGHLPRAISLYISVVSHALMICLTCTPMPLGLRPSGLGARIRQITQVHDTTITSTF